MRPIRIAAQLHPQHGTYRAIRDAAVRAEDLGYDIVYTWDHFYPLYGAPDGPHFECWSLLGRLGRGDRAHRARAARRLQLVSQPGPAGRHGPHGRPRQRRPGDPGHRRRLVPPRLRGVRLPVRDDRRSVDRARGGDPAHRAAAGGARTRHRSGGCRCSSPAAARSGPCASWPVTPTPGMPPSPTGPRSSSRPSRRCDDWCAVEGRDPADIEWSVGVEPDDLERFFAEDAETYLAMGFTQFTLGFEGPVMARRARRGALAWRDRMNRDRVPDGLLPCGRDRRRPVHARPRRPRRGRHAAPRRAHAAGRRAPRRRPSCRASRSARCCGRSSSGAATTTTCS